MTCVVYWSGHGEQAAIQKVSRRRFGLMVNLRTVIIISMFEQELLDSAGEGHGWLMVLV